MYQERLAGRQPPRRRFERSVAVAASVSATTRLVLSLLLLSGMIVLLDACASPETAERWESATIHHVSPRPDETKKKVPIYELHSTFREVVTDRPRFPR